MSLQRYVVFRLTYATVDGVNDNWLPELVRVEDERAKAVALAAMPNVLRVEPHDIDSPTVPGTVLAEAWRRSRRDVAAASARTQLDLLTEKPTPSGGKHQ